MKRRLYDGDTLSAVEGDFEDSPHRDRGPDADRARIGYADFVAICHVVNPKDFGGFRVEANGLYVDLPPADATLTPEERAAVTWHPTGQYDKPALPLPCTLGQLRAFLSGAGMAGSIDEESVAALLGGREYMAGWYNETLDADMWFGLASLTPHEAAMLLCQQNPHEDACDPMKTTTDETGPEDFKRLLRVFEDFEKVEPKARTLRQWLAIARDKGLKYHSWIDAYVMAQIEELTADAGSGSTVVAGATAVSTLPEGIPTRKIVEKFKLSEAWKSKLTHLKANPFLKDALMRQGCRHEGNKRRMPHLWNPVRFAGILIKRDGRNRRAMEAIITHHFADWQDVWNESMESDDADEYAA